MEHNKKPFEKEALVHFFPDDESASFQHKRIKTKSATMKKSTPSKDKHTPHNNKMSVEKAVYATHTQEVSFEAFLKSKQKKP